MKQDPADQRAQKRPSGGISFDAPVDLAGLATTRNQELDCDRFLELLAPYLDERIDDAALREQITHHARQCPKYKEELEILQRALDPNPR